MSPDDPIMAKLNAIHADVLSLKIPVPPVAERVRVEPYTVKEVAALLRRSRMWVSDRCRCGLIRTLPGRGYRIPVGELNRLLEVRRR